MSSNVLLNDSDLCHLCYHPHLITVDVDGVMQVSYMEGVVEDG